MSVLSLQPITAPGRYTVTSLRMKIVEPSSPLLAETLAWLVPGRLAGPLVAYYRRHCPEPWRVVVLDAAGAVVQAEAGAFARPLTHTRTTP